MARRSLFLLRVVVLPKLRRGLVGAVAVFRILGVAETFELGKAAEELDVRKAEALEFLAIREGVRDR